MLMFLRLSTSPFESIQFRRARRGDHVDLDQIDRIALAFRDTKRTYERESSQDLRLTYGFKGRSISFSCHTRYVWRWNLFAIQSLPVYFAAVPDPSIYDLPHVKGKRTTTSAQTHLATHWPGYHIAL